MGDKADPDTDVIEVDGARLKLDSAAHLHHAQQAKHVLSTDKPHRGDKRETVASLIGRTEHLFSVGRLDADSEGMVVMTNDGDLAQRLSHPRYRHTKTYRVEILGLPTAETLDQWQQGIYLDDGKTAPCVVEIVHGSVKVRSCA
ncbi:MAG: pseudouridine synthase [Anaerolineae bacterium]